MQDLEELKTLRQKCKISAEDCAKAIGLSLSAYRGYENNPRRLRVDQMIKLAAILGKSPADIDWYHSYADRNVDLR